MMCYLGCNIFSLTAHTTLCDSQNDCPHSIDEEMGSEICTLPKARQLVNSESKIQNQVVQSGLCAINHQISGSQMWFVEHWGCLRPSQDFTRSKVYL